MALVTERLQTVLVSCLPINDVSGGNTGETAGTVDGVVRTGTNACVSLAGTRRAGLGMSIDTPSITSGSGLVGVCSVCC